MGQDSVGSSRNREPSYLILSERRDPSRSSWRIESSSCLLSLKRLSRIAESGMNETARKEAEKVLNRLRQEGKESVESGMLYDYLDFVTTLSWKKAEAERIDLEQARKILDALTERDV